MNAKLLSTTVTVTGAILLAGCASKITNLTNQQVPQNPSGIYTLSMKANLDDKTVVPETFEASVVVDGQKRPMRQAGIGGNVYDYDYKIPANRDEARYYYEVKYQLESPRSSAKVRTIKSPLQQLEVIDRYVIQMESQRGPVGAEIPVVGRGFSEADQVIFGGYEAQTNYYSPTSISYIVPPVAAQEAYPVEVHSGNNVYFGGTFFVDEASFSVRPGSISVESGKRTLITIAVPNPAPIGGLLVDVTTNVPESVIMPEVVIPEGKRVISVPMEGGMPGSGKIFVVAPGFDEVVVPVTVK